MHDQHGVEIQNICKIKTNICIVMRWKLNCGYNLQYIKNADLINDELIDNRKNKILQLEYNSNTLILSNSS